MSTLDIKVITRKMVWIYGVVTFVCILGTKVYEHFSYGEYSQYMRSMFWFPLVGGMAMGMLLVKLERPVRRLTFLLWNSGIAVLTTGCFVRGIITISGRTSVYDRYYWSVGALFLLGALIAEGLNYRRLGCH